MVKVMVYCEGPTEWHVIRKLHTHGILSGQLIQPNTSDTHIINSPTKITQKFITNKPNSWTRFLLVYDRENLSTMNFVNEQFAHLGTWTQRSPNIFCMQLDRRIVYLHVNDASSPNGYGDFDGYVRNLINILGNRAAHILFSLLPNYIRNALSSSVNQIHTIGSSDIPSLMASQGFPLQRSKGEIFAYITALQMSKSHVWFAEKLVDAALQQGYSNQVQNAFLSLIQAWSWLVGGTCP